VNCSRNKTAAMQAHCFCVLFQALMDCRVTALTSMDEMYRAWLAAHPTPPKADIKKKEPSPPLSKGKTLASEVADAAPQLRRRRSRAGQLNPASCWSDFSDEDDSDPDAAAAWNIEKGAWRDAAERGQKGEMGPMNALLDCQDQARRAARLEGMQSYWADRRSDGIVVGGGAPSPDVLTDEDVEILAATENQAYILSYKS
jgi:hypothetical protein